MLALGMRRRVPAAALVLVLLAATQAVDLRGGPDRLGDGSRRVYQVVRELAAFQDRDRPMEQEVAALAATITARSLC